MSNQVRGALEGEGEGTQGAVWVPVVLERRAWDVDVNLHRSVADSRVRAVVLPPDFLSRHHLPPTEAFCPSRVWIIRVFEHLFIGQMGWILGTAQVRTCAPFQSDVWGRGGCWPLPVHAHSA